MRYLLLLLSICLVQATFAQEAISDGYINYSVSIDSDEPAVAFLTVGSTIEIAFKGDKTKILAKVAGGSGTVSVIAKHSKPIGVALMDLMGEKNAVKIEKKQFDKATEGIKKISDNPIRRLDKTKNIAGYECQKILMKDKESGANIIIYVTDKINPKNDVMAQNLIGELDGFPLGIIIRKDENTVRIMAQKVSAQTPSDAAFSLRIPGDYTLTTIDELENKVNKEKG